jgi:hypothetical protein
MNLDWKKYSEIAERFQYKARYGDRDDLRHNIIVRLAEVASNNGHKPFTEGAMVRVASYVVMEYWHAEKRNGKVISLNTEVEDWEGNGIELIDTVADDNALDLEAWVDARTWLLGCPKRLIQIANKRVSGIALEHADRLYLSKWRKRELVTPQLVETF